MNLSQNLMNWFMLMDAKISTFRNVVSAHFEPFWKVKKPEFGIGMHHLSRFGIKKYLVWFRNYVLDSFEKILSADLPGNKSCIICKIHKTWCRKWQMSWKQWVHFSFTPVSCFIVRLVCLYRLYLLKMSFKPKSNEILIKTQTYKHSL